jgi:hypothetical protein
VSNFQREDQTREWTNREGREKQPNRRIEREKCNQSEESIGRSETN